MGRIHHRQQLDEDQREIRLMQEAFLEDGELHSDNTRNRKFRWKNVGEFSKLYWAEYQNHDLDFRLKLKIRLMQEAFLEDWEFYIDNTRKKSHFT